MHPIDAHACRMAPVEDAPGHTAQRLARAREVNRASQARYRNRLNVRLRVGHCVRIRLGSIKPPPPPTPFEKSRPGAQQ